MLGSGFHGLPGNAVGILSYSNADPLSYRYDINPSRSYRLVVNSDNSLTAYHNEAVEPAADNYLGAIVSPDGSVVYWVNESRPLS